MHRAAEHLPQSAGLGGLLAPKTGTAGNCPAFFEKSSPTQLGRF